jgi:hypothetical protein
MLSRTQTEVQPLQSLSAVAAVSSVLAVDSLKRIPEEYKQSFFGEYDLWLYIAVYDEVLCDKCWNFAQMDVFRGTELVSKFPYLEVHDKDRIDANVHPNCRCYLLRIINIERYFRLLKKLEEREENAERST